MTNVNAASAAMTNVNAIAAMNHDLAAAIAAVKFSTRIADSALAATNLAGMSEAVVVAPITPSESSAERIRDLEREREALRPMERVAELKAKIRRLERQMFLLPLFYVTDFEDTEFSDN